MGVTGTYPARLPAARDDGPGTPYAIALVCLGNICRSPMAEAVLAGKLRAADLEGRVVLQSAGTGTWHLGEQMDLRAAAALRERGYDPSRHQAKLFDAGWFAEHDVVLAMDRLNLRDILALAPTPDDQARVTLFRAFDPGAATDGLDGLDVPDPFYGGPEGFDEVLAIVERTCDALVEALTAVPGLLGSGPSRP